MNITDIRDRVLYYLEKYNYKQYKESRENWVNRMSEYRYLVATTKHKFIDIVKK